MGGATPRRDAGETENPCGSFKGNWGAEFRTQSGITIVHTPCALRVGNNLDKKSVDAIEQHNSRIRAQLENTILGNTSVATIQMQSGDIIQAEGMTQVITFYLTGPLNLNVDATYAEFKGAIEECGFRIIAIRELNIRQENPSLIFFTCFIQETYENIHKSSLYRAGEANQPVLVPVGHVSNNFGPCLVVTPNGVRAQQPDDRLYFHPLQLFSHYPKLIKQLSFEVETAEQFINRSHAFCSRICADTQRDQSQYILNNQALLISAGEGDFATRCLGMIIHITKKNPEQQSILLYIPGVYEGDIVLLPTLFMPSYLGCPVAPVNIAMYTGTGWLWGVGSGLTFEGGQWHEQ